MAGTRMRSKGQLTIPREIREAVRLEEGDPVVVEVVPEGILLRPQKVIDAAQAWFWTPSWQEGEREAEQDVAGGRVSTYGSDDEFLGSLDD